MTHIPREGILNQLKLISLVVVVLLSLGCDQQYQRLQSPGWEAPIVALPAELRQRNWLGSQGEGSCVHASLVTHLRWQNQLDLADAWRRSYGNGEYGQRLRDKLQANQIKFAFTNEANPAFLDWAHHTRRGCILWWKQNHCCTFAGYVTDGRTVWCVIIDNNHPERLEFTERNEFIRRWEAFGGFGLAVMGDPIGPLPYQSYRKR